MLNPQNVQASYTPTDNIGIIANGFYRNNSWSVGSGGYEKDFNNNTLLGELGVGYYTTFGSQENMVFETYVRGGGLEMSLIRFRKLMPEALNLKATFHPV